MEADYIGLLLMATAGYDPNFFFIIVLEIQNMHYYLLYK
jgi:predicted Zn-dependent protease